RDSADHHLLDAEAGAEFGTTGGELDDAVAARIGEAFERSVDGLRGRAVDRREREGMLLGSTQHLCVDLGRCDGHEPVPLADPCSPASIAGKVTTLEFSPKPVGTVDTPTRAQRLQKRRMANTGIRQQLRRPGWPHPIAHMVKTIRKRARPSPIAAYASAASASGRSSIHARTPDRTAKCIVSSTSRDVPDGWPATDRPGVISWRGAIGSGSAVTPTMTSSPSGARPPTVCAIAAELAAVASTTDAPPRACNASATSLARESM